MFNCDKCNDDLDIDGAYETVLVDDTPISHLCVCCRDELGRLLVTTGVERAAHIAKLQLKAAIRVGVEDTTLYEAVYNKRVLAYYQAVQNWLKEDHLT